MWSTAASGYVVCVAQACVHSFPASARCRLRAHAHLSAAVAAPSSPASGLVRMWISPSCPASAIRRRYASASRAGATQCRRDRVLERRSAGETQFRRDGDSAGDTQLDKLKKCYHPSSSPCIHHPNPLPLILNPSSSIPYPSSSIPHPHPPSLIPLSPSRILCPHCPHTGR